MHDAHRYWYPPTSPHHRPGALWYVGWVLYANRWTLARAFALFSTLGGLLLGAGLLLDLAPLRWAAYLLGAFGTLLLANSVAGLTLIYGPPARHYLRRLLKLGQVDQPTQVADLHIGTYRISYLLQDLLPEATISSVDIWDDKRYETERALVMLRELEVAPIGEPRIRCHRAEGGKMPLAEASCDVVVLGLGLHEIPAGGPREELLGEARRILKPGGSLLFFEHTVDLQSLLVFGFEIDHWVRPEEWRAALEQSFDTPVAYQRSPQALALFALRRT